MFREELMQRTLVSQDLGGGKLVMEEGWQLSGHTKGVVWGHKGALQRSLQELWMPELLKGWYRWDLIKSYSDAHMAAEGS